MKKEMLIDGKFWIFCFKIIYDILIFNLNKFLFVWWFFIGFLIFYVYIVVYCYCIRVGNEILVIFFFILYVVYLIYLYLDGKELWIFMFIVF